MKRFRIFEDSAPFSLVIKQIVQENTSSEQQPFTGEPVSTLGVGSWGGSALRTKKQSVRGKPLNHDGLMEGGTGIKVLWYRE